MRVSKSQSNICLKGALSARELANWMPLRFSILYTAFNFNFNFNLTQVNPMHLYSAHILWTREEAQFLDNRYSRRHLIRFDGGAEIYGSSSPHVVKVPMSDPSAVDPEEAFVASLSSCHMLWFLSIAASRKYRVDTYSDQAEGVMEKNSEGKLFMSVVTLRPVVSFSGGTKPTSEEHVAMHHRAHEECFIANSVLTKVRCAPRIEALPER